jgi:hypothetical protein
MYSETNKKDLLSQELPASGQEKPEEEMCDCELCLRPPKPKLTFEASGRHKWNYLTHSRKRTHQ